MKRSAKEHVKAIRQEVRRLKEAGVIKEIFFPKWQENTVVVKKKNGKWKVCIDFTDLKLSMPKGPISYTEDRSIGGCHIWAPEDEFSSCLSRLPPNCPGNQGSRKDSIYLPSRQLPLYCDAI